MAEPTPDPPGSGHGADRFRGRIHDLRGAHSGFLAEMVGLNRRGGRARQERGHTHTLRFARAVSVCGMTSNEILLAMPAFRPDLVRHRSGIH